MHNLFLRISAALAVIMLSACVSTYQKSAASAHNAFFSGDYDRALKLIDEVKPARRDKLLHLLDRGMILHAAGKYEESNVVLTEAEELSDALSVKSLTREFSATLWSEEATEYAGERHERAMIPVIRMLNYIMLDDWDGALVEVRRLENIVEKVYGAEHDFDNAFSVYLSAIIWETLGHINDALIDYKSLAKKDKDLAYYGLDLSATSSELGLPVKLPPKESAAWQGSGGYRKNKGQLIIIALTGRSPSFVADYLSTGYFTVSVPRAVMYLPLVSNAQVSIDGKEAGLTHQFYNIADDIQEALKERTKRSFIRKVIKMSVQTGLYAAGLYLMDDDDVESQIAGIALSFLALSMSATDKADERSWRTLPASFQIGRFYLPPGKHEVEIKPEGVGDSIKQSVEIGKERPRVLIVRFPKTELIARGLDETMPAYAVEAQNEQRALMQRVHEDPTNASLKIELAEAKIQGGDYDVEQLLISAIKEGGNKQRAMQDLVIAYTVKGKYPDALGWAQKLEADEPSQKSFVYYSQALEYIAGSRADKPLPDILPLTYEKGLVSGFECFIKGLVDEKSGNYQDAVKEFAKAHELGLVGEPVVKRVISSYQKTDDTFKNSEEGVDIISNFAESFLTNKEPL
jgi:hypothetical protein